MVWFDSAPPRINNSESTKECFHVDLLPFRTPVFNALIGSIFAQGSGDLRPDVVVDLFGRDEGRNL